MKKKDKRTAIVLTLISALLTGCSLDADGIKEPEPENEPVISLVGNLELTPAEQELVNHSNEFAFNLFRQIPDSALNYLKSKIVSPLSITYALGMLNNGATGNTQAQINEVLGFGDTGADSINEFCYKMIKTAPALDTLTKVLIANNIYMNKGYTLKDGFIKKAKSFYNAEPETRDFYDGKTMDVINKWASDHTERMIDRILDEDSFDPQTVSYLLNAIYFKGSWTYKFDKSQTKVEEFILPDDKDGLLSCEMMQMHSEIDYAETDQYQAVSLPYGNGSFQMTVLLHKIKQVEPPLPIGELDIAPKVPTLEQWQELNRNMSQREVMLKLPRFETESNIDLIEIMKRLGMTDAFNGQDADFSNFCNVPVYIGLMKQVAKIKLDEEGTEAAAATVIGIEKTSELPSYTKFYANRPFIYVISEKKTGAIFFIGQYTAR